MDRIEQISIAQLRTFRLVMTHGSYAAAAKVLHLTVPSAWQHVQSLEKAYGVSLFVRSGRQVKPTDAAHKLLDQVESILVQLESTFDVIDDASIDQPIRMVTGVRMMLEDFSVPLARFQRNYTCKLTLRHGNGATAERLLLADEADIALSLEPGLRKKSPRLHYEPAYTVDFLAVAKRNHPFSKSKSNSLRELSKHPLVVTAVGTHGRDALDQAFHRDGLTSNIVVETDNSAFTLACVAAGMGVGILAGRTEGELSKRLTTISLTKQLGRKKIVMIWRKGRLLTEPMLGLVEELKRSYE